MRHAIFAIALLAAAGVALYWLSHRSVRTPSVDIGAPHAEIASAHGGLTPSQPPTHEQGESRGTDKGQARAPYVNPDHDAFNFEAPSGRYSAVIPQLWKKAEGGDANAAYTLARLLIDCYLVGKGQQSGFGSNDPDRCTDTRVTDPGSALHWLQFAADKGVISAQLLYPDTAAEFMTSTDMIKNPTLAQDYRERSMSYLTQAARAGSPAAMTQLSTAYSKGILTDQNTQLAYAYEYAAEVLSGGPIGDIQMAVGGMNMTPEQVAAAKNLGEKIIKQCCK